MKVVALVIVIVIVVPMLGESHMVSPFASDGDWSRRVTSSGDKRPNRKLLKEKEVVLEDYGLIDPSPATKTSVGPKPIDHGSPLIPFIPQQPSPRTPPSPTYDALSPPTIG